MITIIDKFQKFELDLSGTTNTTMQYYFINDLTFMNTCTIYFFLKSYDINCKITFTIEEYIDENGIPEYTQVYELNNKNKFLNKQIDLNRKYTLLTVNYEPCIGTLHGYFEKRTLDLVATAVKYTNLYGTIDFIPKIESATPVSYQNYSRTGLNMYQVIPKRETYRFNAYTNNINSSILVGSYGSNIQWNDNIYANYGIGYPRNWYVKISDGSNNGIFSKSLSYTYIDNSGNTLINTTTLDEWNTYYQLKGTNIVSILKWNFIDYSIMNNEYVYISPTNNDDYSIYGGWASIQCNSIFTVPKNAIAWINSIQINSTSSVYLSLFRWDAITSMRDIAYTFNNITTYDAIGTDYSGIGGIFNAGETIGWGSSGGAVATYITANITVEYF